MITALLIWVGGMIAVYLILIAAAPFQQHFKTSPGPYLPFVSVIIPCKGSSREFTEFLICLQRQRYQNVELLFCLASQHDPAIGAIQATLRRPPHRIVVSKRIESTCEKNQNTMAGIKVMNAATEVVVFLDSDGTFDDDYLRSLIEPLQDPRYASASTYRLYNGRTPGSMLTKYWNAYSLGFKLFPPFAWVWAGGYAVRARHLEEFGIPHAWIGTVSDDQPLNRQIKKLGLKTFSIRQYTRSVCNHSLWNSVQWISRQSFFAQRYFKPLHYVNIVGILIFFFYLACLLWTGNLFFLAPFVGFLVSIGICLSRYGTFREWLYLPFISIMILFVTLYATLATPFMKRIRWGEIVYTVDKNGLLIKREPWPHTNADAMFVSKCVK